MPMVSQSNIATLRRTSLLPGGYYLSVYPTVISDPRIPGGDLAIYMDGYNRNTAWLRDTVRQTSQGKSSAAVFLLSSTNI